MSDYNTVGKAVDQGVAAAAPKATASPLARLGSSFSAFQLAPFFLHRSLYAATRSGIKIASQTPEQQELARMAADNRATGIQNTYAKLHGDAGDSAAQRLANAIKPDTSAPTVNPDLAPPVAGPAAPPTVTPTPLAQAAFQQQGPVAASQDIASAAAAPASPLEAALNQQVATINSARPGIPLDPTAAANQASGQAFDSQIINQGTSKASYPADASQYTVRVTEPGGGSYNMPVTKDEFDAAQRAMSNNTVSASESATGGLTKSYGQAADTTDPVSAAMANVKSSLADQGQLNSTPSLSAENSDLLARMNAANSAGTDANTNLAPGSAPDIATPATPDATGSASTANSPTASTDGGITGPAAESQSGELDAQLVASLQQRGIDPETLIQQSAAQDALQQQQLAQVAAVGDGTATTGTENENGSQGPSAAGGEGEGGGGEGETFLDENGNPEPLGGPGAGGSGSGSGSGGAGALGDLGGAAEEGGGALGASTAAAGEEAAAGVGSALAGSAGEAGFLAGLGPIGGIGIPLVAISTAPTIAQYVDNLNIGGHNSELSKGLSGATEGGIIGAGAGAGAIALGLASGPVGWTILGAALVGAAGGGLYKMLTDHDAPPPHVADEYTKARGSIVTNLTNSGLSSADQNMVLAQYNRVIAPVMASGDQRAAQDASNQFIKALPGIVSKISEIDQHNSILSTAGQHASQQLQAQYSPANSGAQQNLSNDLAAAARISDPAIRSAVEGMANAQYSQANSYVGQLTQQVAQLGDQTKQNEIYMQQANPFTAAMFGQNHHP